MKRKGNAIITVTIIAAIMLLPVAMLAKYSISQNKIIPTEAVSEKSLYVADAVTDRILNKINMLAQQVNDVSKVQQGLANIGKYYTNNPPSNPDEVQIVAVKYTIGYMLSKLNGGTIWQPDGISDPAYYLQANETTYPGANNVLQGSVWDVEDNVSTWLYNLNTNTFYIVANPDKSVKPVSKVGVNGDITTSDLLNLDNNTLITGGIKALDSNYATDNKWAEIDVNVQYEDDGTHKYGSTKFKIRTSAYLLTKAKAKAIRSVLAEATLKNITAQIQGSSSSNNPDVGPFKYAVWSGQGFILNGVHTIQSGHKDSNGNIAYDGKSGSGDVYATGQIILNGENNIYGNIVTSLSEDDDGIIANGPLDMGVGHKFVYNQKENLPDFAPGTEDSVKSTAMSHGKPWAGDYEPFDSTINVNGIEAPYYISGDADFNGWGITINFYPQPNDKTNGKPFVDWYINGNLTINGDATLNFGDTPGIIWVHGDIVFNGDLNVKGSGTIVSDGSITLNGCSNLNSNGKEVAIISEGQGFDGQIILNGWHDTQAIIYAPHSDVILNGGGNIFGSVVAGGYVESIGVVVNGNQNITYDTAINNTGNLPPLPAKKNIEVKGVSFEVKNAYRLSWREIISDPVTPQNIENTTMKFNYVPIHK